MTSYLCIKMLFIYSIHNDSTQRNYKYSLKLFACSRLSWLCCVVYPNHSFRSVFSTYIFYYNQGPPGEYFATQPSGYLIATPHQTKCQQRWFACATPFRIMSERHVYLMSDACDKANVICLK